MDPIPKQIGPYRVLGVLAADAVGSVLKAEFAQQEIVAHEMIGRLVDTRIWAPGSCHSLSVSRTLSTRE